MEHRTEICPHLKVRKCDRFVKASGNVDQRCLQKRYGGRGHTEAAELRDGMCSKAVLLSNENEIETNL